MLGILGMIAGLVVLRRPGESLLALLLVLGIWLIVSGAISFFRSFQSVDGRALLMLVALAEIVLGVLILALPDLSLRTVAMLAGIGFLLRGHAGDLHRHPAAQAARLTRRQPDAARIEAGKIRECTT